MNKPLDSKLTTTGAWLNALVGLTAVIIIAGHLLDIKWLYMTTETSGTSIQTAILFAIGAFIIQLDKMIPETGLKIKFAASCTMLVYLGTMLFDSNMRSVVDTILQTTFSSTNSIKTSDYTILGLLFSMISAASYAVNNRVMSISFAYFTVVFPLAVIYDFVLHGSSVLGGMSIQTGVMMMLLGMCLYLKRLVMFPFRTQILNQGLSAEVIRISYLGIVVFLFVITVVGYLNFSNILLLLLIACFVYQHILFNHSIVSAIDIRSVERAKEKIYKEAVTDSLTKVGNRVSIKHLLTEYKQCGINKIGIMLFDIDFFKLVNDRYGHDVGDEVLYDMCRIVELQLRNTDRLIRWGGEEFMVIVPTDNITEIYTVAENIRKTIEEREISKVAVTISSGVTIGEVEDFDMLVNNADKGLYHSKHNGRNRNTIVDEKFIEAGRETGQFITLREVEEALHNNELYFVYQPVVDCLFKKVVGIEALIRWNKNDTIVGPSFFVDKLNSVMLTNPKRNASKVFEMMSKAIIELDDVHPDAYLSFNVNIMQLADSDNVDNMLKALDICRAFDRRIMIEILEVPGSADTNDQSIIRHIERIRSAGHMIALDDFGVEDSNLVRLIMLPIDIIKFDRKIATLINPNEEVFDRTILMLNSMCESFSQMGIQSIVIEGVEKEFQAFQLSEIGLTTHQGWYHAMPLNAEELAKYQCAQRCVKRGDT